MSLNALAIDIMLPALGFIAEDLGIANENDRQWIITSYIFGMGIGSIIYGSLSDRYGRKPVLGVTMIIYVIFGLLCSISETYEFLLIARFIQGLAAAAMGVLVNSIIRDRFHGDAMARTMSIIMMVFMAVPVVAPIVGQGILVYAEWPVIFVILSIIGFAIFLWMALRLPETLDPANKTPINLPSIILTWKAVITNRNSVGHVIASGLMMGPLFAFIASAQQIFFDTFDARELFVYMFGINAGTMAVCSFVNSRIVMRFGARRVSQAALVTFIVISITHLVITLSGLLTLPIFVALLATSMGMIGFTGSNFSSIAMQPFGKTAGVASSFQNFTRTVLSAVIGGAVGMQFNGTTTPLVIGFAVCGFMALLFILWAEHGKLFRRIHTGLSSADVARINDRL